MPDVRRPRPWGRGSRTTSKQVRTKSMGIPGGGGRINAELPNNGAIGRQLNPTEIVSSAGRDSVGYRSGR